MEAPKCKLCGERHYGLCPTPDRDAIDRELVRGLAAEKQAWLDAGKPEKPKYDRNAAHRTYMKDYMRKRRDREKAEALRMRKRRAKDKEAGK